MKRLSTEELRDLHATKDYRGLWAACVPWVDLAISSLRISEREDVTQAVLLEMGREVKRWDPVRGKFQGHIYARARFAAMKFLKASKRDAQSATALDSLEEDEFEAPGLTYADTSHIPEGFGDIASEIAREGASEAVERLLARLDPRTALCFREIWGLPVLDERLEPQTVLSVALARGKDAETFRRSMKESSENLSFRSAEAQIEGMALRPPAGYGSFRTNLPVDERYVGFWQGLREIIGDGAAWRESVGGVYGDWSWKPDNLAIKNGCKP